MMTAGVSAVVEASAGGALSGMRRIVTGLALLTQALGVV